MTRAYEDSRAQGPIANRLQSNKSPGALQDFGRISNREVKRMNLISRVMVVFGVLALILAPASKRPLIASEASEQAQIRTLLQNQTEAWNRGDIDGFMAGYWKSDETAFVGAILATRGWRNALEHYTN